MGQHSTRAAGTPPGTFLPRSRSLLLAGLIALVATEARAQASIDAELGVALDALRPSAFAAETRSTFSGSLAPELLFASEHGRLHYQLEGGSYNSTEDWGFLSHSLGARYRLDLSAAGGARLYLGASGTLRRNGEAWSSADYQALSGFANFELRPRDTLTVRAGYRVAKRAFAELPELTQLEQGAFASVNLSFSSGTTAIAEAHVGLKAYDGDTGPATLPLESHVGSGASSPSGRGGRGMAANPGLRPADSGTRAATGDQARQLNLLLRLAQGLGERTGVWAQGFARRTGGSVPPAVVATPAGFFDDGVYDDPFASKLDAVSAGLKHVFASGAEADAAVAWQGKSFTSTSALDSAGLPLPGTPLRRDRIWRANLDLSIPVLPDKTGAFSVGLELGYSYTRSISNDAFYDYASHQAGVAVTLSR